MLQRTETTPAQRDILRALTIAEPPRFLASGKPAVVQHTGPSRILPDSGGLFRVRDVDEAAACLETVAADYEHQCGLARTLAEAHFDAREVVAGLLERALA